MISHTIFICLKTWIILGAEFPFPIEEVYHEEIKRVSMKQRRVLYEK